MQFFLIGWFLFRNRKLPFISSLGFLILPLTFIPFSFLSCDLFLPPPQWIWLSARAASLHPSFASFSAYIWLTIHLTSPFFRVKSLDFLLTLGHVSKSKNEERRLWMNKEKEWKRDLEFPYLKLSNFSLFKKKSSCCNKKHWDEGFRLPYFRRRLR